ncbi:BTB/POZ protein, partial [Cunninghamella echinulata]
RDALIINGETLGLYDIPPISCSNEFGQLLNNPELSDFVIVPANGQELHVHQVILITKWPHFRHMYRSGMTESQQRRMEISEPYEVVLAFLKYLYSDQLDEEEPWQVICDVLVMANMYLLNRFKKVCCQRLYTRHLNIDTCCYIFEKAMMAEEPGLKLLALDFMFQHYGAILKLDLLHQISGFARQEFYKCIPYEASLLTNQSRFQIMKNTCALTTSIASVSASLSPTSSFSTN